MSHILDYCCVVLRSLVCAHCHNCLGPNALKQKKKNFAVKHICEILVNVMDKIQLALN